VTERRRLKEYLESQNNTSMKKKGRQFTPPWTGKLEAVLDFSGSPTKAIIKDLRDEHKNPQEQDLICLKCQTLLE